MEKDAFIDVAEQLLISSLEAIIEDAIERRDIDGLWMAIDKLTKVIERKQNEYKS